MEFLKNLLIILNICVFFSLPKSSTGQNSFEGIIRYEISQTGSKEASIPPGKIEYYLKEENLILKAYNQTGKELAWILLKGKNQSAFLIDEVQKTAFKIPVNQIDRDYPGVVPDQYRRNYEQALKDQKGEQTPDESPFHDTGEKENIAGYSCKKLYLENIGEDNHGETILWVTGKIKFDLPEKWRIREIPLFLVLSQHGFPLKLVDNRGGNSIIMAATEVIEKKLEDKQFNIPEGFSISDISSLKK